MRVQPGCFVHVPKTGGSSVVAALRASLGRSVFHTHEGIPQSVPLEYLLSRYPLVAGHFTLAQLSPSLLQDSFVFTVVREPVDRALSLYYFYRAHTASPTLDHRVAAANALDLNAFVERLPQRVSPWSNWQTFVFSGAHDCEQPAELLLPAALANLRRLALVGVCDDLDAFLHQVAGRWALHPPFHRVNSNPARVRVDQIDPQVRSRLARLNDCDTQLLAYARMLWKQAKVAPLARPCPPASRSSASRRPATVEHGTREILISDIHVVTERGARTETVFTGERFAIRVSGVSDLREDDATVGIRIDDHLGIEVYGVNTRSLELRLRLVPGQPFAITFALSAHLGPGVYHVTAAVHRGPDHLHRCYHWIENATAFECRAHAPRVFSGTSDLQATATCEASASSWAHGMAST